MAADEFAPAEEKQLRRSRLVSIGSKDLSGGARPAPPERPEALIAFILENFHAIHRAELPELQRLAAKVERVHGDHADCPAGLAKLLLTMEADLEEHMHKEEAALFPMFAAGGGASAQFAVRRMLAEHDDHTKALLRLAELTCDFTPPVGACGSWRALYKGCAKLNADLREHIRIENEVLFPQFS